MALCTLISSLYYLIHWVTLFVVIYNWAYIIDDTVFIIFLYFYEELIIIISSTNKHNSNKISLCRNTL